MTVADLQYAWDHATYCGLFVAQAERLAEVAAAADPGRRCRAAPGGHSRSSSSTSGSHTHGRRPTTRQGSAGGPVNPKSLDLGLPDDPEGLPAWLSEGAERSARTIWEAGPDADAWTFGPVPHARFWARRMLHETLMHRVDAELALGIEPDVSAEAAVDGIDELLTILPGGQFGRPDAEKPHGQGETLHIHTSGGVQGEWTVTLTPRATRGSAGTPRATRRCGATGSRCWRRCTGGCRWTGRSRNAASRCSATVRCWTAGRRAAPF
ncbi:maleylpyruvate isomerase family mycothiol-dependent enzyme [Yinghuangia aomiensis]